VCPKVRFGVERVGAIVSGRLSVSADTDLRLCKLFGLSNGYWLRAQAAFDTEIAEDEMTAKLKHIRPWQETNLASHGT
jgi:plasmid maintenance system antidote protein VapI